MDLLKDREASVTSKAPRFTFPGTAEPDQWMSICASLHYSAEVAFSHIVAENAHVRFAKVVW